MRAPDLLARISDSWVREVHPGWAEALGRAAAGRPVCDPSRPEISSFTPDAGRLRQKV